MKIKPSDFPILAQQVNQHRLVYLDSAATSQKPASVLAALNQYYTHDNANVHRGIYDLSQRATTAYELARDKVQHFIHAKRREEILFTRGTTEAINWVAQTYGMTHINPGDEIVISYMEHHANIVPWQQLAKQRGATLKYIRLAANGTLDMHDADKQITARTKIVSITQASNVLGVVNPIKQIAALAHAQHAVLLVDGAQSVPHMPIDVQQLDADFFVFSGHKMMGPTGIGVLYGKRDLLAHIPPAQFGGEMVTTISQNDAHFQPLPWRFEAGTPNIAGAIGLGAAIDYLLTLDMVEVAKYEQQLTQYALESLHKIDAITIYGADDVHQTGIITFNMAGVHAHDLATALDQLGIAVRAGHHCAQPLMRYLGVAATVRMSFYVYNTLDDIDDTVAAIKEIKDYFKK